jgi:20S proteasome alpha/beta subunit
MLRLHKKYNVDRSRLLGSKSTELYFQPNSLLGVSITTGTEKTFELYHLHADPWVEPIEDYETVGSGAPFADLLMKQLVRQVEVAGDTWKDVTVDVAIKFVSYYMNEIKTTDIGSGGSTRVSLLDQNGLHDLTNDEISKHHQEFIERLTKGLSQIPEEAIKKVFSQT